jgi:hypothetical protein
MSLQSIGLPELLEGVIARIFAQLFVSRPAKVERYDEKLQQVDVRPMLRESYVNADGEQVVEPPALVQNVPLVWPGASGGFLSFGFGVGDIVALVYFDRSSDRWKSLGEEVDPVDVRRHHPSDAWAIPGLHAFNAPLVGVSANDTVLSVKQGAMLLLGSSNPTDFVALASKVNQQFNLLKSAMAGWTPVPSDGGAALKAALTTLFSSWPSDVGSTIVKVAL